jgi:hypothetical protein
MTIDKYMHSCSHVIQASFLYPTGGCIIMSVQTLMPGLSLVGKNHLSDAEYLRFSPCSHSCNGLQ